MTNHDRDSLIIVGNPDSIYIKRYVEEVLIPEGKYKILIVDIDKSKNQLYASYYNRHEIDVITPPKKLSVRGIGVVRTWFYIQSLSLYIRKKYDPQNIHGHFASPLCLCLLSALKNRHNTVIISYWGSDILRALPQTLLFSKLWLGKIDKITFDAIQMKKAFEGFFSSKYEKRISILRFGVNGFDSLKDMEFESSLYKKIYGIDDDKIVITIGYNGRREQQHEKVIMAIDTLSVEEQRKMFVLVPMTYGVRDDGYIQEVENSLRSLKISGYMIFKDFMDDSKVAKLRCVTDIFIHAQTTDAFSSSVQEFLYAKKIVLNPTWIPYDEHEEKGLFYFKYDSFETLHKEIRRCVCYLESGELNSKLENNHKILNDGTSWEAVAPEWRKLYERKPDNC